MPQFPPTNPARPQRVPALKPRLNARMVWTFFTRTNSDRGRERYRRAGLTASTSMFSQALAIFISLVSVPLTVHYLGAERYGVWLTISSLLTWMMMTDFGLAGIALVNVLAEAHGKDDRESAREYAASVFWALTAITLMIGVVFVLTFSSIPWQMVFRVSDAIPKHELHQACALTLAIFVLTFPLNMVNSVYSAYQDGFVASIWTIASNLLALIGLVVVTHFRGGLPELVFALSGTRILVAVANSYYLFFHRYRWLAPHPSAVRWSCIKRLFKLGSKYMISQLAGMGISQSQPMLITQVLGPSYVAIFVIVQRIISLPLNLVFIATNPLVSAYSEAKARGDWNWIKDAFQKSMIAGMGCGIAATSAIVLAAKPLIRFWAGPAVVPDVSLVIWLGVYTLIAIATLPTAQMLNGLERVSVPAVALALCALGTVKLGIVFVQWWGLMGLAIAMSVSLLLTYCPALVYEFLRVMRTFSVHLDEAPFHCRTETVLEVPFAPGELVRTVLIAQERPAERS